MRAIKQKNTGPEISVRQILHSLGYRFRLHRRDLPGTPDIVLAKYRLAIQVHGCFWHQHKGCAEANKPKTWTDYWLPKLARNAERDTATAAALSALGWRVMVIWECEARDRIALVRSLAGIKRSAGNHHPAEDA